MRSLRAAVLAARRTTAGQLDAARAAVVELEAAVRLQDAMGYDEPPSLYASRRPALALAVLEVGEDHAGLPARAAAAAILREELSRLPRSPEALGLCAEAQQLDQEVEAIREGISDAVLSAVGALITRHPIEA